LAARFAYAAAALATVGAVAFYASMWLLPRFGPPTDDVDGYAIFQSALGIGLAFGFSAALLGLTLPWRRRRRRSGRGRRTAISAAIVVFLSLVFASREHDIFMDLLFAAWLAYSLAFTYVRYGVRDSNRTRISSTQPQ
jgi:uncharacterized membrane protein YfcA